MNRALVLGPFDSVVWYKIHSPISLQLEEEEFFFLNFFFFAERWMKSRKSDTHSIFYRFMWEKLCFSSHQNASANKKISLSHFTQKAKSVEKPSHNISRVELHAFDPHPSSACRYMLEYSRCLLLDAAQLEILKRAQPKCVCSCDWSRFFRPLFTANLCYLQIVVIRVTSVRTLWHRTRLHETKMVRQMRASRSK